LLRGLRTAAGGLTQAEAEERARTIGPIARVLTAFQLMEKPGRLTILVSSWASPWTLIFPEK